MGYQTPEEYLAGARSLLQRGAEGNAELYLKGTNPVRDLIAHDPATRNLAIFGMDGLSIRTFFTARIGYLENLVRTKGLVPV